ncbi:tRNA:m(4)X modification enzyme TRM13 homolog isoform X1 [Dermacentor andersoni]|uniref:tRNA:m(4)X modification enzyme TRM13 homolog isoform X1 n=1 Tax=Dermacentor andersoni TaxID=34620 RepID=UPI002155D234|nr:tRNA:m(4)X modification enzyme TRM13 homolog isoform X1 [Dermacentor andersoni]
MGDNKCNFIVARKGRRCRLRPLSGSHYCGEHVVLSPAENGEQGHDRITCPLDSTHTCSSALLDKHLKKCNAKKKEAQEFFIRNINSGTPVLSGVSLPVKTTLKHVSDERLWEIIHQVEEICDGDVTVPEKHVGLHWAFDGELEKLAGCVVAEKHLRQKAALLSLAERQGLLTSNSCFVEFGAGRGRLSYWLAKILAKDDCHFLLVDRAASRHKFENKVKSDLGDVPEIQRLQIDIRHLCLGNVHLVKAHQKKLVGLCKHLCGEATDLALRCLMETTKQPSDAGSKALLGVHGVLMATCCHHRCYWDSFVGRPLLEAWGLGRQDFDLISAMAGWATCAAKAPQAGTSAHHFTEDVGGLNRYLCMGLSVERRTEVGRRCKLLLDTARARYLSAKLNSRLVYFITPDVTPENVAILATANAL